MREQDRSELTANQKALHLFWGSNRTSVGVLAATMLFLVVAYRNFPAVAGNVGMVQLSCILRGEDGCREVDSALAWIEQREPSDSQQSAIALALDAKSAENDALAAWRALPDGTEQLIVRGNTAREPGFYPIALEWYERATEVDPTSSDAWYLVGDSHFNLENFEEAAAAYSAAIEQATFADFGVSDALLQRGRAQANLTLDSNWLVALPDLESAESTADFRDPLVSQASLYFSLGIAYNQVGQHDRAIQSLDRAVDGWPHLYWPHLMLGEILAIHRPDSDRVEQELRAAIALDPDAERSVVSLAQHLLATEQAQAAVELLSQYQQRHPDNATVSQLLSSVSD